MLTVSEVSSSGPGLLTETICVGIAGTIPEAGRGFGGGSVTTSVSTSTGGRSTPIARTILGEKSLEMHDEV